MKKSTKRCIISTATKNSEGFTVRTEGIDTARFSNNPQLLWMHSRPFGYKGEPLPLGVIEDLKFSDGKLYGTPVFDTEDQFAAEIYRKWENGTLRMVSPGLRPKE